MSVFAPKIIVRGYPKPRYYVDNLEFTKLEEAQAHVQKRIKRLEEEKRQWLALVPFYSPLPPEPPKITPKKIEEVPIIVEKPPPVIVEEPIKEPIAEKPEPSPYGIVVGGLLLLGLLVLLGQK